MTVTGLIITSLSASPQSLIGDWSGKLQVTPQASLKLVFHISDQPAVSMDSPDQGAYGIAGDVAFLSADSVCIKVPKLMMGFSGRLRDGRIEGTFEQRGMKLPLTLEPGEAKPARPQTPQPPFPYSSEEITITHGDVSLGATLTIPDNPLPSLPVAVMVTGSGPQNRDEEVFGHRPFAVIADYLARNGIASIRYDDRGVGKSKGDVTAATTADFAEDAQAVADWTRANKDFGKVGIIGHSEGGIIAFMLGAKPKNIDFIVSVAGPAVRGDSILVFQNLNALSKAGVEDSVASVFGDALRKAFSLKIGNPDMTLSDEALSEIYPSWNDSATTRQLAEGIRGLFRGDMTPWMQHFISYSPSAALKSLSIPAFLIYGEKDMQVPPSLNACEALRNAPEATVKIYPKLNHLMQHAVTGNVEEYNSIEETISPEVLSDIAAFIATQ